MVMTKTRSHSKMHVEKDKFGKEVLLNGDKQQVRMEWEKPYIEACIDALKPHGDVLEIGFGLGYSAEQIQSHSPRTHIIIESNPEIAERAKEWAAERPKANIKVINGRWQEALNKLGKFNAIFFDDYFPVDAADLQQLKMDSASCQKVAEQAGKLHDALAAQFKQFAGIKFSDQDLHAFAQQVIKRPGATIQQVLHFIDKLVEMKNITKSQRDQFVKEFEKSSKTKATSSTNGGIASNRVYPIDHFSAFVEACLTGHMQSGARLSAYMGTPESQKGNPIFQNVVLSRKDVHYSEKPVSVDVPPNCDYFQGNKALIILIEKK